MPLYLGSSGKRKIYLNKIAYVVINTSTKIIRLLSSDNYILKDCNGVYLTVKEGDK